MSWLTGPISTANLDSGVADSPAAARADLRAAVEAVNAIIDHGEPVLRTAGTLAVSPAFDAPSNRVPDLEWIRKGFTALPSAKLSISGSGTTTVDVSTTSQAIFSLNPSANMTLSLTNPTHGQRIRIGFYQAGGGGRVILPGSVVASGAIARGQGAFSWLDAVYSAPDGQWQGVITQANLRRDGSFNTNQVAVVGAGAEGAGTYTIQGMRYSYGVGLLHFTLSLAWSAHSGSGPMAIKWLPEIAASSAANGDWILVPARVTVGVTRYDGASLAFKGSPDLPRLIDAAGTDINIGAQGSILLSGCIPFA